MKIRDQKIEHDIDMCGGTALDRLTEIGPRGGVRTYWRAAYKRDYLVSAWCCTQREAAGIPKNKKNKKG